MFKLLKSKKGFTLVELMIVVVIMAILVAVAVPIFSAVTKNARIKTCAANRREIVSQVNGLLMGNIDGIQHKAEGGFIIESDGTVGEIKNVTGSDDAYTSENFASLFQATPYCPAGSSSDKATYEVSIVAPLTAGINETTATVTVTCTKHPDDGTEL